MREITHFIGMAIEDMQCPLDVVRMIDILEETCVFNDLLLSQIENDL